MLITTSSGMLILMPFLGSQLFSCNRFESWRSIMYFDICVPVTLQIMYFNICVPVTLQIMYFNICVPVTLQIMYFNICVPVTLQIMNLRMCRLAKHCHFLAEEALGPWLYRASEKIEQIG